MQIFLAPSPGNDGDQSAQVVAAASQSDLTDDNEGGVERTVSVLPMAQQEHVVANSQEKLFSKLKMPMLECLLLQQDPGRKLPKRKHELVSMCLNSHVTPDQLPSEWEEALLQIKSCRLQKRKSSKGGGGHGGNRYDDGQRTSTSGISEHIQYFENFKEGVSSETVHPFPYRHPRWDPVRFYLSNHANGTSEPRVRVTPVENWDEFVRNEMAVLDKTLSHRNHVTMGIQELLSTMRVRSDALSHTPLDDKTVGRGGLYTCKIGEMIVFILTRMPGKCVFPMFTPTKIFTFMGHLLFRRKKTGDREPVSALMIPEYVKVTGFI